MSDNIDRSRHIAAWHEAGHATASWLEGVPLLAAQIIATDGTQPTPHSNGMVWIGGSLRDVCEAIAHIEIDLAGEATAMTAVALGWIPEELLAIVPDTAEAEEDELGAEADELAEIYNLPPAGDNDVQRHVHYGWTETLESQDQQNARAVAERVSNSPDEALALISYVRTRVMSLVQHPRFRYLAQRLAGALLDETRIEGPHITRLLERWDHVYEPPKDMTEEVEDAN
jgi:hypothetical protein